MSGIQRDGLVETGEAVASKADFIEFVRLLLRNYRSRPDQWENASLDQFHQYGCWLLMGRDACPRRIWLLIGRDARPH
jgi:hypothetical protein